MNYLLFVVVIVGFVNHVNAWRIPTALRRAIALPLVCSALSISPGMMLADERGIGNDSNVISDEEVCKFIFFFFLRHLPSSSFHCLFELQLTSLSFGSYVGYATTTRKTWQNRY